MKYGLAFLFLSFLLFSGCNDPAVGPGGHDPIVRDTIPAGLDTSIIHPCVLEKISYLQSRGNEADTNTISQFYLDGQFYYLYNAECCDRYNALYDSACNFICCPSGGISGGGDGSCPDFLDRAVFIKIVWKNW